MARNPSKISSMSASDIGVPIKIYMKKHTQACRVGQSLRL